MKSYADENIVGWLISEKLDGVRAYWTGRGFRSKSGRVIRVPRWFMRGLPATPLDGELWLGRGRFDDLVVVLQRPGDPRWREVRYMVNDSPAAGVTFARRSAAVPAAVAEAQYAVAMQHDRCEGLDTMRRLLAGVLRTGGEGLVARDPDASDPNAALKIKPCPDAEGVVVGYTPSRVDEDRIGALIVQIGDEQEILVGAGLNNEERDEPPAIGTTITYRYRGLSRKGLPLQATYWRRTPEV